MKEATLCAVALTSTLRLVLSSLKKYKNARRTAKACQNMRSTATHLRLPVVLAHGGAVREARDGRRGRGRGAEEHRAPGGGPFLAQADLRPKTCGAAYLAGLVEVREKG